MIHFTPKKKEKKKNQPQNNNRLNFRQNRMYNFIPALSCFIFIASQLLGREGGLELPLKLVINCLQRKKNRKQKKKKKKAEPFEMFPL